MDPSSVQRAGKFWSSLSLLFREFYVAGEVMSFECVSNSRNMDVKEKGFDSIHYSLGNSTLGYIHTHIIIYNYDE